MSASLFRPEALESQRSAWLGGISIARPLRARVLAWFAFGATCVVVLFLLSGEYTRRIRVAGSLVPVAGQAVVLAPATGVVRQLVVREGDRSRAGQTLGMVTVPRATRADGDTARALASGIDERRSLLQAAAQAEGDALQRDRDGLQRQIDDALRERTQLDREIAIRAEQVVIARDTLERMRSLRQSGYVSELQTRQQEAVVLDGTAAMQALERQKTRLARDIAALGQSLATLAPRGEAARVDNARRVSELERERIETAGQGEALIAAPVSGVISSLPIKPGQTVVAGQPLLTMLPGDGALEAELLVPSRAVGFVEPGDAVLLRYRAYPYQKFGHHRGRVVRVSRSALTRSEIDASDLRGLADDTYYRVVVRLQRQSVRAYGREERLQPGMLLDADILGERRRLIEWVFEPLYSLRGALEDR